MRFRTSLLSLGCLGLIAVLAFGVLGLTGRRYFVKQLQWLQEMTQAMRQHMQMT